MATYYFADNAAPNAHANAIQGNDSWNGLSPVFTGGSSGPKRNPAGFDFNVLQAGDTVLFAIGGYWSNSFNAFIENPASSSLARTNMIRFGQYDPGTGVTGKPWFNSTSQGFQFGGYGGSGLPTKGGILVENLKLTGPGFSGDNFGIVVNPPWKWFVIQDCDISGYKCGINVRSETDCNNWYVKIRRNALHGNGLGGLVGTANWMTVEGNDFYGNGELHALTHAIYAGSGVAESTAITFQHNHIYDNNIDGSGVCVGGNLTCRGKLRGTYFDDNVIENTGGKYNASAYGISHRPGYSQEEHHFRTKMRRNTVRGMGSFLSFSSAPDIEVRNNYLHDNGLIADGTPSCTGIGWPVNSLSAEDTTTDRGAQVTGNTFVSDNPRTGTNPISVAGGTSNYGGPDIVIDGNTIQLGSGGTVYAMSLGETNVQYDSISNNTLIGGSGWTAANASLAAFEAYYDALAGTTCTGNSGP